METEAQFAKITHAGQRAFLEAFRRTGVIKSGCKAADVSRSAVVHWMKDPVFAEAFQDARDEAGDRFEEEAIRRAVEGVEKPVTVAGERETVIVYSDELLKTVLAANKPEKYKNITEHRHTGPGGGPIKIDHRADCRAIIASPRALELCLELFEMLYAGVDKLPDIEQVPQLPSPPTNGTLNGHVNGHLNGLNGHSNGEAH